MFKNKTPEVGGQLKHSDINITFVYFEYVLIIKNALSM